MRSEKDGIGLLAKLESEFIYTQSNIPQTAKHQPFTDHPISVVYLGYLSRIVRYPKYTTEVPSLYDLA